MHIEKSSLVLVVVLFTFNIRIRLWLLEHVCLRVDLLKDAAGSSFGKADRLCLYLHDQKLCRVEELQHQLAHQCSPNIIGIWEWDICGLMGGAFIT